MLNAGLSTLAYLKSRLLPEASQDETTWDAALSKLGLAIAERMQTYCARNFSWLETASDEFSARNLCVTLTRYPVVEVSDLVLAGTNGEEVAMTAGSWLVNAGSGVIEFCTVPGTGMQRLRVLYAGGYWLEGADAQPDIGTAAAAVLLPEDLLENFVAEVQRHAEARGLFEAVGLRTAKDAQKALAPGSLSDACREALYPYRRFAGG